MMDTKVVQAVVAWLLYDWETRQKHAFNLMSKIDFDKVTKEVLEQIVDGDILESIDCKELHDKATSLLPELKTKTDKKEKSTMITAPLGVSNEGETKHMEYLTHDRCGNSMIPVWKTIRPFTATYPSFIHYTPETVEGLDVDPNPYPEGLLCYNWFRLIAGDGILYAQVSYHPQFFGSLVKILYRYNFKENTFEQVFRPHASFTEKYETIYMDKCFYFVDTAKGIINSYDTTTEILKLDHKPMLQPFWSGYEDDEIRYVSSYMGRVLVYGPLEADGNCFLQAYDPAQDLWCMVMEDILPLQVYPYEVAGSLEPIIMQHNGTCYRIAFYSNCNPTQGREQYQLPIVHELNFKSVDGILSAKVGEEIEQSNLPIKTFGAFQIDDDLFVYGKGDNVYKTGQKAWNGPWDESKLEVFDTGFPSSFLCNYVRFTFDSLQLANDDSDSDN